MPVFTKEHAHVNVAPLHLPANQARIAPPDGSSARRRALVIGDWFGLLIRAPQLPHATATFTIAPPDASSTSSTHSFLTLIRGRRNISTTFYTAHPSAYTPNFRLIAPGWCVSASSNAPGGTLGLRVGGGIGEAQRVHREHLSRSAKLGSTLTPGWPTEDPSSGGSHHATHTLAGNFPHAAVARSAAAVVHGDRGRTTRSPLVGHRVASSDLTPSDASRPTRDVCAMAKSFLDLVKATLDFVSCGLHLTTRKVPSVKRNFRLA